MSNRAKLLRPSFHIGQRLFTQGGAYMGPVIKVYYSPDDDTYEAVTNTGWHLNTTELNHGQGFIGKAGIPHASTTQPYSGDL